MNTNAGHTLALTVVLQLPLILTNMVVNIVSCLIEHHFEVVSLEVIQTVLEQKTKPSTTLVEHII